MWNQALHSEARGSALHLLWWSRYFYSTCSTDDSDPVPHAHSCACVCYESPAPWVLRRHRQSGVARLTRLVVGTDAVVQSSLQLGGVLSLSYCADGSSLPFPVSGVCPWQMASSPLAFPAQTSARPSSCRIRPPPQPTSWSTTLNLPINHQLLLTS